MLMCSLLAAGCVTGPDEDLSTIESLQLGAVDDPCLSEAADKTMNASGTYTGYAVATSLAFLTQGTCTGFIAQWQTTAAPPDLYAHVAWSATAATSAADCARMTSTARVYKRRNASVPWQFVGEIQRSGSWEHNACRPKFGNTSVNEDALVEGNTLPSATIRIVAAVNRGTQRLTPTVILDDTPIDTSPDIVYDDLGPDDPCLTEAADVTLAPSGSVLGFATPQSSGPGGYFGWLHNGACDGFITDWTRPATPSSPIVGTTYSKVGFGVTVDAESCPYLAVRERVYSKNGSATEWKYVGETIRRGVWKESTCLQMLDSASDQVAIPGGGGTRRTRIVSTVNVGTGIGGPTVLLDNAPLPEN